MSIVLRVNKGSALTYDEMDRNQSQFYFSSSLHQDGSQLRLHYTGSVALADGGVDYSPRYHSIPISTGDIVLPAAAAAGNNTEIQFNDNDVFGADSLFIFEKTKNYLGLGTAEPDGKLHIVADGSSGAETILQARSIGGEPASAFAGLSIREGASTVGKIGRTITDEENYDLLIENHYIVNQAQKKYGKIRFAVKGNTDNEHNTLGTFSYDGNAARLGVGLNATDPARTISVVGVSGIGFSKTTNYSLASYISPIPVSSGGLGAASGLNSLQPAGSNKNVGLLISSPNTNEGGNIIAAINTDVNEKEAFNIVKSIDNTDGQFAGTSSVIASFQANGNVGINTNTASNLGLTVAGMISGSGDLNVEGTATVKTINDGSAASTSALVATSTGLVQKIAAAPVPLGGIIMWSGTIGNIPDGWTLCDGSGGANNVNVPDLTDRFIVGATADGAGTEYPGLQGGAANSMNAADAVVIDHNHGGYTGNGGSHRHQYKDTIFSEESGAANNSGYIDNVDLIHTGGANRQNSTDSNGSNVYSYSINRNTEYENSHQHPITSAGVDGTNKNLPPYYALAFIIYVGA